MSLLNKARPVSQAGFFMSVPFSVNTMYIEQAALSQALLITYCVRIDGKTAFRVKCA